MLSWKAQFWFVCEPNRKYEVRWNLLLDDAHSLSQKADPDVTVDSMCAGFTLLRRFEEMGDRSQEPVRHMDEWEGDSLGSEVGPLQRLVVVQHCWAQHTQPRPPRPFSLPISPRCPFRGTWPQTLRSRTRDRIRKNADHGESRSKCEGEWIPMYVSPRTRLASMMAGRDAIGSRFC